MTEADPLAVALEVGSALDALAVPWHLGGSLASSIHGFARATLDADIVADLRSGHGSALVARLGERYYADGTAIEDAIARRASFNLIHLESMFKVDVFVPGKSPFERESFARSREEPLGTPPTRVRVATPEDTVLHKLAWYEKGGRVSDRQWGDVVGVLRVQGTRLDVEHLRRWATELNLVELLDRALHAASAG